LFLIHSKETIQFHIQFTKISESSDLAIEMKYFQAELSPIKKMDGLCQQSQLLIHIQEW